MASDLPSGQDPASQFDAAPSSFFPLTDDPAKPASEPWGAATIPPPLPTPGAIVKPDLAGPLLTCKAFLDLQSPAVDITEAKKVYQQYRQEYELRFAEIFYTDHKTDPWFIEKYDPLMVHEALPGRLLAAQLRHKQFISDFQGKVFTGVMLRDTTEPVTGPPLFAFDPNHLTLFLGLIPITVWRKELLTAVHAVPGFVCLCMSEPIPSQGFCRFAWARFDTQAHCEESCKLLSNVQVSSQYAITATPSQKASRRPLKTQPPQSIPGLTADWRQVTALIAQLDKQYQVGENQLVVSEERFAGLDDAGKEEQVDLELLYLRRVYGVCYYCGEYCEDERELAAKCGPMHLRSKAGGMQESGGSVTESRFADMLKKCVVPTYDPSKDEKLATSLDTAISSLVLSEPLSKVRCSNCKKLFFDEKYLRKHITTKHDDVLSLVRKAHFERLMFERFLQESCKFVFANGGGDNARTPAKRGRDELYEDLDDPKKGRKMRKVVDYSDI